MSTSLLSRTTITVGRKPFLDAIGLVGQVVPPRSPKAEIQDTFLFEVEEGGRAFVTGTDLEVMLRVEVKGVTAKGEGKLMLPLRRVSQILQAATVASVVIEEADNGTENAFTIRTENSEYNLVGRDPSKYPMIDAAEQSRCHRCSPGDLRKAIDRTAFACDAESTRYALGGTLLVVEEERLGLVGTDGRRLAEQFIVAEKVEEGCNAARSIVVPLKALKVLRSLIAKHDDGPVELADRDTPDNSNPTMIVARGEGWVLHARLVEGRFPRYQDVFVVPGPTLIDCTADSLLSLVSQAMIMTSDESRAVDLDFSHDRVRASSQAADVGSSKVEVPVSTTGPDVTVTLDPRYVAEMLRALDPDMSLAIVITDHKTAVTFTTADKYTYVVMPLSRDRN